MGYTDSVKKYLEGLEGISLADWQKVKTVVESIFRYEQREAEKNISFRNEIAEKFRKHLP